MTKTTRLMITLPQHPYRRMRNGLGKCVAHAATVPSYHKYARHERGVLYWLCKPLTESDKNELLAKFINIELFKSQSEYAPEMSEYCLLAIGERW